ncbi:glycoside hydrolase family 3 C-terminal domain-containing protein, partial [Lachnotalea glycerini]
GLDVEMSVTNNFDEYYMAEPLKKEILEGNIDESLINEKVRNILRLMERLHMLSGKRARGYYNIPKHQEEALAIARESIVLLKNENKRLPLCEDKIKKLLVIGENANKIHSNGGGSAEIKALYEISPLMGLKKRLGGNTEVIYVNGYYVEPKMEENDANWQETSLEDALLSNRNKEISLETKVIRDLYLKEAVEQAKRVDEVILFGGLNHDYDSEGIDRDDMKLPYDQDRLIQEVLKVNPNTVIVMVAGSPVEMGEWIKNSKAVMWSWYAGMEGGTALAEALFGDINPSGKLPVTFPNQLNDCPAHLIGEYPGGKKVSYLEGIQVGYRYYDTHQMDTQFCFGYGLSYTEFAYKNLSIIANENEDVSITVSVETTNIGCVEGSEILQLYIASKNASVERPLKELKEFQKVLLKPNETKEVIFTLDRKAFGFYDVNTKQFKAESGRYEICIGSSSKDIRLQKIIELNNTYYY